MNTQAYMQYQKTSVETISPGKLLLMLFDGAINSLNRAKTAIEIKDVNKAHNELVKVQDIITELMTTLKMDYEISKNLLALYDYYLHQLMEANMKKDIALIDEVLEFFAQMRDIWEQANKQVSSAPVAEIPVKPLRKVTSLSGPFTRFSGVSTDPSTGLYTDKSADAELLAAKDDYLEIHLTDRGITENARETLRKRFPYLLSLRQDEALAGFFSPKADFSGSEGPDAGHKSVSADFRDFLAGLYGKADEQELELFDTLLAETEAEDALS